MTSNDPQVDYLEIIQEFYPDDTPLRRLLLKHSGQVRDKALALLRQSNADISEEIVEIGAMLHDIGICRCHAPGILCEGSADYMAHGVIGASMLREYGKKHNIDLEMFARICERHTGTGLTAADVVEQHLPIPVADYLPVTPLECLICLADKFFSKSGDMQEKPLPRVRASLEKFGAETVRRLDELCHEFGIG